MTDYINLLGAEDVRTAGNRMASAAEEMQRAASAMSKAFQQHQRFLDNWLNELDGTLKDRISDFGQTIS